VLERSQISTFCAHIFLKYINGLFVPLLSFTFLLCLLCNFRPHILGKRKKNRYIIPILNVCGTKDGAFTPLQSHLWAALHIYGIKVSYSQAQGEILPAEDQAPIEMSI